MRLLLDTHALLWWWFEDPRLSRRAVDLISDETNEVLVSAASLWEIATKHRLGKLEDARDVLTFYPQRTVIDRFIDLPMTARHGIRAGGYRAAHRDPFDRVLAAQSELEDAPIVSRDPQLAQFPCSVIW